MYECSLLICMQYIQAANLSQTFWSLISSWLYYNLPLKVFAGVDTLSFSAQFHKFLSLMWTSHQTNYDVELGSKVPKWKSKSEVPVCKYILKPGENINTKCVLLSTCMHNSSSSLDSGTTYTHTFEHHLSAMEDPTALSPPINHIHIFSLD